MRWLGVLSKTNLPDSRSRVTGWWHGKMPVAPVTWASRNIGALTDNGTGDITLTFLAPYQATPAVMFGGSNESTGNNNASLEITTITGSSIRFATRNNFNNVLVEGRKISIGFIGDA